MYSPSPDLESKSDAVKSVFLRDNRFKIGKGKKAASRKIKKKILRRSQRLKKWRRLKSKKEKCDFV